MTSEQLDVFMIGLAELVKTEQLQEIISSQRAALHDILETLSTVCYVVVSVYMYSCICSSTCTFLPTPPFLFCVPPLHPYFSLPLCPAASCHTSYWHCLAVGLHHIKRCCILTNTHALHSGVQTDRR